MAIRMIHKNTLLCQSQYITQHILDIFFPPQCAGCKRSGAILCSSCVKEIRPLPLPLCQKCGSSLPSAGECRQCQGHPLGLSGLRAVSVYQEPLRSFIHAFKYAGNTRLAEPLGHILAQFYTYYGIQADMIIPVPLHPERQRQRGYNHAFLLGEVCAAQVGVPMYDNVLTRLRATSAQVGLTGKERYQNMAGAFVCTAQFATDALFGRRIVIIDDVYTTGATLQACAGPLFAAGARSVWGLVLARP